MSIFKISNAIFRLSYFRRLSLFWCTENSVIELKIAKVWKILARSFWLHIVEWLKFLSKKLFWFSKLFFWNLQNNRNELNNLLHFSRLMIKWNFYKIHGQTCSCWTTSINACIINCPTKRRCTMVRNSIYLAWGFSAFQH